MLLVQFLQVVGRNRALPFSCSLLDAAGASERVALDIDDSFDLGDFVHFDKIPVAVEVDLVLSLV